MRKHAIFRAFLRQLGGDPLRRTMQIFARCGAGAGSGAHPSGRGAIKIGVPPLISPPRKFRLRGWFGMGAAAVYVSWGGRVGGVDGVWGEV